MRSTFDIRGSVAAATIGAALVLAGCSRAPEAPSGTATDQAAPAGHGHAAADHDHDRDHDHAHDHGDHEHPQTLPEGVRQLAGLAASVKQHLASDARDEADDAVHGLAHLLEDLQGLVRTSTLAGEAKAGATKALDELFECFDALDAALHAEPGKGDPPAEVHAAVEKRIEAAVQSLTAAVEAGKPPAASGEDPVAAIIREAEEAKTKERE